jgi:hypothetical protein
MPIEAAENTQTTLRDALEAAVEEHAPDTPAVQTPAAAESAAPTEQTQETKAEARARDEAGRFAPKAKDAEAPPEQAAQPVQPAVARPPRPSSWKKDYWEHWDKLDPKLAEYINQREGEYAKGVSTYKQEWERAKPVLDALAPHLPLYQQYGIDPAQQISKYAEVHRSLALGTPEQKLNTFLRMAQEYQVPVQNLFQRGQDGQIYYAPPAPQAQQAQPTPQTPDVASLVDQKFQTYLATQQTKEFISAKDAGGNLLHPHVDAVRDTMAQILEAGLADDIPSAYEAAIRHPRHSDIFEQLQQQQTQQKDAERQQKMADEAKRARRQAVSPRTATPAGQGSTGKKGLRSVLEEQYDEHISGRV